MTICEAKQSAGPFPCPVHSSPGDASYPLHAFVQDALCVHDLKPLYLSALSEPSTIGTTERVLQQLELSLSIALADLARIPRQGPALLVANHPSGLQDALFLDALLQRVRPDARLLTSALLRGIPALRDRVLPVHVRDGHRGETINRRSLNAAATVLAAGGLIAMFPAGEAAGHEQRVAEPGWTETAALLALKTRATVVPVYLGRTNSIVRQLADLARRKTSTDELSESPRQIHSGKQKIRVGPRMSNGLLKAQGSPALITEFLRDRTLGLHYRTTESASRQPRPQSSVIPVDTLHSAVTEMEPALC